MIKVRSRILVIFSFYTLLYSCGSNKHMKATNAGTFIKTPVTIDGKDDEWPSPYPYYDSKAKISYAVANDGDYLYITLKASDRRFQQKIMRGGLKVWIDPSGKKEESLGINYPMKQESNQPMERRNAQQEEEDGRPLLMDTAHRHSAPMLLPVDLTLTGFYSCNGSFTITAPNPCNIKVSMNRNEYNELVWEASVPLSAVFSTTSHTGSPLSICFEIGGMVLPARNGEHGGGQGGHGGGGMRQGGMSGGMGHHAGGTGRFRPNDEDIEALAQTTKTWVKAFIARPKN